MPSMSTKGSPSMIMRSAKVALSPLVGIADDVFLARLGVEHGVPLDACREARTAAAAQAAVGHFLDDVGGVHGKCGTQALQPAMGFIVCERERVDHAANARR